MPSPQKWVCPKEAASAVGVHPKTLRRWLRLRAVIAKRLASGTRSRWLVALDADGHTIPSVSP